MKLLFLEQFKTKNLVKVVLLSVSLWLTLFTFTLAESINSFEVDIMVHDDSSLTVTETITYDFGNQYRHGIYRNLSNTHAQSASKWYKEKYIDYELVSVKKGGVSEQYVLQNYDGLSVRIGDPNKTISGSHTYEIKYKVFGALSQFGDTTELYWNVTGDEWDYSIENVQVFLYVEENAVFGSKQYCYAGVHGSNKKCDFYEVSPHGSSAVLFKQEKLAPRSGLTIATELSLPNPIVSLEKYNLFLPSLILGIIGLLALIIYLYRWKVEFNPRQTVIPQYEPLPDFKPMFTGVLIDNRLDPRDITAGILYLAEQGFISIKHVETKILYFFDHSDYEITLLREVKEVETKFLSIVLELLFSNSTSVGHKIMLSKISHSKKVKNAKAIRKLKKSVIKDLSMSGFLEKGSVWKALAISLIVVLFLAIVTFLNYFSGKILFFDYFFVFIFAFFFIFPFIVQLISVRRTRKGYEALNHLKGFKDFLKVTGEDRFAFHNAPGLNPQQFLEYLPYAIAFGVEKEWTKVFKDIQIDNPDWYISSNNNGIFDASSFTNNISAFSTAFAGSTGSSGSSGGGSSGGGSGGGGGGSW